MSAHRLGLVSCALLALVTCMACKDDPTQIILSIDTDYAVPAQLARLHYEVFKRESDGREESRGKRDDDLLTLSKDHDFPRTLAITSTHGREYAVRVVIEAFARNSDKAMVHREAIASFRKGRILSLPMNIVSACAGVSCKDGFTCGDNGQCEPIDRSLHGWTGEPPRLMDGGMGGDGDGDLVDAGQDAGHITKDAGQTDAATGGDGDAGMPIAPNDVIAGIALGMQHTCAWTVGGTVYCWGDNNHGALGDTTASSPKCPKGEPPCTSTPVEVPDIHDATKVVASEGTTCALRKNGHVYCWGFDGNGGLGTDGQGPGEVVRKNVQNITLTGVTDLAAGRDHICALAGGAVWCWGKNVADSLGTTSVDANGAGYAVAASVDQGATKLYPAFYGGCVERAKQIECWGSNAHGELRSQPDVNMDINFQATPVAVYTAAVSNVSIGDGHVCLMESDAQSTDPLVCWGLDDQGQLGIGPSDGLTETCEEGVCSTTPLHIMGLASRPVQVMSGMRASCARFADTSVACWGSNFTGVLAEPMNAPPADNTPSIIQRAGANFTGVTGLPELFYGHVCVLRGKREIWCWGDNYHGQSGDLTSFGDNLYEPRRVPLPAP